MLLRHSDWPGLLAQFLKSRRKTPFRWGENDCALFTCDGVLTMTGVDLAREFRGYTTERGAGEAVARFGSIAALAEYVTDENGMAEVSVARAHRGDVVLFSDPAGAFGQTLGLVSMDGSISSPGETEMIFNPISLGLKAWKVG